MEKITASEGMYLTQKEVNDESSRVFSISVYLADNDSADNWREATQEEYYKWQRKQDENIESEMAQAEEKATTKEV